MIKFLFVVIFIAMVNGLFFRDLNMVIGLTVVVLLYFVYDLLVVSPRDFDKTEKEIRDMRNKDKNFIDKYEKLNRRK